MMEWQPIETAPKDGTEFMGWNMYGDLECRCSWAVPDGEKGEAKFCVWELIDYEGIKGWEEGHLTHWMPLPPPPSE